MNNKAFVRRLEALDACSAAIGWTQEHGGTLAELFRDCRRGDWMAWYLGRSKLRKSPAYLLALADCAALAVKALGVDTKLLRKSLSVLRKFARGRATAGQVDDAYYALRGVRGAAAWAVKDALFAVENPVAAYTITIEVGAALDDEDKGLAKCADVFRKYFEVNGTGRVQIKAK